MGAYVFLEPIQVKRELIDFGFAILQMNAADLRLKKDPFNRSQKQPTIQKHFKFFT